MSERLRNRLYVLALVVLGSLVTVLVLANPTQGDRLERLGNSIRCPVCQGESIADSPSSMARDMMALLEQRLDEGLSDQEVIDELLSSYSGAVLLDPPASGSTLFLWLAPILALAAGAGVIVWWERHPGGEPPTAEEPLFRNRRRVLVGGIILATLFAVVVVAAGFFLQDEPTGPASGIADLAGQDLDQVSNETMEAVIAANLDNPQISGMRLALAERYFAAGDYRAAFPHYLAVAESAGSTESEAVAALVRLGWMAWDGNGEAEAAIGMFDQALAIEPASSTALYLKGRVEWCGIGDFDAAERLFATVIANDDLPPDSLTLVTSDLDAVMRGEACA